MLVPMTGVVLFQVWIGLFVSQSEIYGFFFIPQKTLENGLKLIHSDVDLDIMYDMAVRR